MRKKLSVPAVMIIFLLFCSVSWAGNHGEKEPVKKGILLVAFGSTYPQAQAAFDNIEAMTKKSYPDVPVRWAYTSKIIRHKLAGKGRELDSPAVALAKMMDEDFTQVAVQSLHTIAGAEFHDLQSIVNGFQAMSLGFETVLLGYPLLAKPRDLLRVRDALLENIPDQRGKDEAVLFMGHGTHHPSNAFYQALAYELQKKDRLAYLGTVEGSPALEEIVADLEQKEVNKVYLMPFMSVAGDHARNDMAGPGEDSWKSVLEERGYEVQAVLKGTAEYDNIAGIWVEHLEKVMSQFKN